MPHFEDVKISQDEDGAWHAASLDAIMSVIPDKKSKFPDDKHIFHRNFIKFPMGEHDPTKETRIRVLVGRIDDVRVYLVNINPPQIIMTKQDLNF